MSSGKRVIITDKGKKVEAFAGKEGVSEQQRALIGIEKGPSAPGVSGDVLEAMLGKFNPNTVGEDLNIDMEDAEKQFKEWYNSDDWKSGISKRKFYRDVVLVEIFQYEGDYTYGKTATVKNQHFQQSAPRVETKTGKGIYFPIARVLAVGENVEEKMEVGDIVELNDSVMGVVPNPLWDEWMEKNSDGLTTGVVGIDNAPPRFLEGDEDLSVWRFTLNKFDRKENPHIYRLPKQMLNTNATDEYFIKYSQEGA